MKRLRLPDLLRPARSAFTLVEVLVGISISSLVIGAAYTTWFAASSAWDKARILSRHHQQARVALDAIERAARAAMPPDAEAELDFVGESVWTESLTDYEFEADRLRLATTAGDARFGPLFAADLCEVEFVLDRVPDAALPVVLMRRRTVPEADSGGEDLMTEATSLAGRFETALLATDVVSFDVDFLGELGWDDEWYGAEELPQAIEATIVFADPEGLANPTAFARLIGLPTYGAAALDSTRAEGGGGGPASQPGAPQPSPDGAPPVPQPPGMEGPR